MKSYEPQKLVEISRYPNYFPTLSPEIQAETSAIFVLSAIKRTPGTAGNEARVFERSDTGGRSYGKKGFREPEEEGEK